jgi:hypothetical protein
MCRDPDLRTTPFGRGRKHYGGAVVPSEINREELQLAEEVSIQGTSAHAKIRNPLGVVALSLITFGIYFLFWYYFVNRELKDFGEAHGTDECGTSPGTSLLAVSFGAFIIVPPFISIYNALKRMNAANRIAGSGDGFDAGLGILLWIFLSPVAVYIYQQNLNKVWESQNGPVTTVVETGADPA